MNEKDVLTIIKSLPRKTIRTFQDLEYEIPDLDKIIVLEEPEVIEEVVELSEEELEAERLLKEKEEKKKELLAKLAELEE